MCYCKSSSSAIHHTYLSFRMCVSACVSACGCRTACVQVYMLLYVCTSLMSLRQQKHKSIGRNAINLFSHIMQTLRHITDNITASMTQGYDFSICSASTRARTLSYQAELDQAFLRVEGSLLSLHAMTVEGKTGDILKDQENGQFKYLIFNTYCVLLLEQIFVICCIISSIFLFSLIILLLTSRYY